jgi:hypothetical protein
VIFVARLVGSVTYEFSVGLNLADLAVGVGRNREVDAHEKVVGLIRTLT